MKQEDMTKRELYFSPHSPEVVKTIYARPNWPEEIIAGISAEDYDKAEEEFISVLEIALRKFERVVSILGEQK